MKRFLLLLPVTTAVLALVSGCQTGGHDSPKSGPATASAAPSPAPTPTAPPAVPQPPQPTLRIKAGGVALKDASGTEWLGDTGFDSGDVIERPELQIANTTQPEVYRSEHYAMAAFKQALPNGKYVVRLHFAETYEGISGPGERVFSFEVAGKVFKDFDVWARSGGFARAYVETVPVEITDGVLNIKFTPQVENPQICGIEILPAR